MEVCCSGAYIFFDCDTCFFLLFSFSLCQKKKKSQGYIFILARISSALGNVRYSPFLELLLLEAEDKVHFLVRDGLHRESTAVQELHAGELLVLVPLELLESQDPLELSGELDIDLFFIIVKRGSDVAN